MSGEWQSISLDVFALEQTLEALRGDLRQLREAEKASALNPNKETLLQAELRLTLKAFEIDVKKFEPDCHEVENIYHQNLLKEIRSLIDELGVEMTPMKMAKGPFRSAFFKEEAAIHHCWTDVGSDIEAEDEGKTDGEESPAVRKAFNF